MTSCLHCVLTWAVRAEARDSRATFLLPALESLRLPVSGIELGHRLRRLLRRAGEAAGEGRVKVKVVGRVGTSEVEVLAVMGRGRGARLLSHRFPRHARGSLEGGFAEVLPW